MKDNPNKSTLPAKMERDEERFQWRERAPNSHFKDYQKYIRHRETPAVEAVLTMVQLGPGWIAKKPQVEVVEFALLIKKEAQEFVDSLLAQQMVDEEGIMSRGASSGQVAAAQQTADRQASLRNLLPLKNSVDFAWKLASYIREKNYKFFLGLARELEEQKVLKSGGLEPPIRSYLDGRRGASKQAQGKWLRLVEKIRAKLFTQLKGDRLPFHEEMFEKIEKCTDNTQPKILDAMRRLGIKLPKRPKPKVKARVRKKTLR